MGFGSSSVGMHGKFLSSLFSQSYLDGCSIQRASVEHVYASVVLTAAAPGAR
jgi:hypothetical protein